MGPKNHALDGVQISLRQGALLTGDMCRPIIIFLRMANVPAQRTWAVVDECTAAAKGDMTKRQCGLLPNYFGHFSRDRFIWLVYQYKYKIHKSQPKLYYLILTFRSHNEIFIRRSWYWYSVLPSLDATISCRIKKAVVGVTQLTAFLMRLLIVTSRLGRAEYQLLLIKIS